MPTLLVIFLPDSLYGNSCHILSSSGFSFHNPTCGIKIGMLSTFHEENPVAVTFSLMTSKLWMSASVNLIAHVLCCNAHDKIARASKLGAFITTCNKKNAAKIPPQGFFCTSCHILPKCDCFICTRYGVPPRSSGPKMSYVMGRITLYGRASYRVSSVLGPCEIFSICISSPSYVPNSMLILCTHQQ